MSSQPPSSDVDSTTKLLRSRVFKPAEGVFLFHPRALERLITEHLGPKGFEGSIPDLTYYVMPRQAFLSGLESENPEALAVIEGLNLPLFVILLPMPMKQRLGHAGFARLLRDFWARRFEGEIARAWQTARDERADGERFGPAGLQELIGSPAFAEVRDVLTRDCLIPAGVEDALVCRGFVAHITRLRYFCPGVRGFFFPAVLDWAALDHWLEESGLGLPPLRGGHLPDLLERARPDQACAHPALLPLLPSDLPYGTSDPDFESGPNNAVSPGTPASILEAADAATEKPELPEPHPLQPTAAEARCLAALRQGSQLPRRDWRRRLWDGILGLTAPLLAALLALPALIRRRGSETPPARGIWLTLHLILFRHAVRTAQRAEYLDRYGTAVKQLARANQVFETMGEPCAPDAERVRQILVARRVDAEESLAGLLAANWKLPPNESEELTILVKRLGADSFEWPDKRAAPTLLKALERVLLESRTTYYQLRPLSWLLRPAKTRIRQVLPFQANLKALRALDTGLNRLEQLGWPISEVERFSRPLRALAGRLTARLERKLKPHLRRALQEAGFTPTNHREEVAAHKLLHELLDVIQRRGHLKFTDVRDIVARNVLRLPDLALDELLKGDRLARFDHSAARALPGVYKPGEFYIKGLQQLGAPLFGTPQGRLVLRHLVLPFGLAFLGLKTLDVLIGLIPNLASAPHLASLWLVGIVGVSINAVAYTRTGRLGASALLRGLWWAVRLLLFDGLRRLLHWHPVSVLLANDLVRGLDRHLLRPFLIGTLLVLPFVGLGSLIAGELAELDLSLVALVLALGTLVRNTPAGRRVLDNTASTLGQFLRRLNQALVIGLVQALMQFFKEFTRRFQQGLHLIEELLSHHLGESRIELGLKSLLLPIWRFFESLIQFYVTVLVEPQVNPIKHFPLVTIAHKLMLPFLPVITGFLVGVLDPLLPKWITYPFVTLTIILLPGLGGFLVWELKENWKIYAANHRPLQPGLGTGRGLQAMRRADLPEAPIEPAVVGNHGETMRGLLRRGFNSGTLPKAFDRLRRVLRSQIRDEVGTPYRLREARRHLAEVERSISVFCERELVYSLRRRCKDPNCGLSRVGLRPPRLATSSVALTLELDTRSSQEAGPIELRLSIDLLEPELYLGIRVVGPRTNLGEECWRLIREDLKVFSGRVGASRTILDPA